MTIEERIAALEEALRTILARVEAIETALENLAKPPTQEI